MLATAARPEAILDLRCDAIYSNAGLIRLNLYGRGADPQGPADRPDAERTSSGAAQSAPASPDRLCRRGRWFRRRPPE